MREPAETFEHAGLTVEIHFDQHPSDPREDFDHVGVMVCWHPDYILGDEQFTDGNGRGAVKTRFEPDNVRSMKHLHRYLGIFRDAGVILPLSIYDHSGITMYVGGKHDFPFDSAGWDTTVVGFIYVTRSKIKEEWGEGPDAIEKATAYLRSEVSEYDAYLTGQVYGYVVKSPIDEDSCWGFYDREGVIEASKEAAEHLAQQMTEDAAEEQRAASQDIATQRGRK